MLLDKRVKLPFLEQLGRGAQGKTENGNGRTQPEGLLQGPGRTHFVVAEANAKPSRLPAPRIATAPAPAHAARIRGALLRLIVLAVVGHRRGIALERKCAASGGRTAERARMTTGTHGTHGTRPRTAGAQHFETKMMKFDQAMERLLTRGEERKGDT